LIVLILFSEEHTYELWGSTVCSFLQLLVTSSVLDSNILLSNLFSNVINLCSSLNEIYRVLHPYKTTGEILIL
jgi:hypothetical protein